MTPEAIPREWLPRRVKVQPCAVTTAHYEHETWQWPEEWCPGIEATQPKDGEQ
jgi:hypothetical protein